MTPIDETMIRRAANAILRAALTGSIVILFGSCAKGTHRTDSDLDFLVVEPHTEDRFTEMARLSRLLGEMLIPADVVVVSREYFNHFQNTPNTIAYEASRNGRVYESVA